MMNNPKNDKSKSDKKKSGNKNKDGIDDSLDLNNSEESLNLSEFSTTMSIDDFEVKGHHRGQGRSMYTPEGQRSECQCGHSSCDLSGGNSSEFYDLRRFRGAKGQHSPHRSADLLYNDQRKAKSQEKTKKDKRPSAEALSKESIGPGPGIPRRKAGSKEFINLHAIYSTRAYWTRATNALNELQLTDQFDRQASYTSKSSMVSKRDRLNMSLIDNERNDNHPVESSMSGIENFVEYRSTFHSLFNSREVVAEMKLQNLDRLRGLPTDPFVFLEHVQDVRFLNRMLKPYQLYVFMTEYMYGYYDMEIGESNLSPKRIQLDEILWDTLAPLIPILCRQVVETILYKEPVVISVTPPCIVLGDIHGNLNDVWYIHQHFISNPDYADYKFVFLGDYVDRGAKSVEVVVFLFLLKCIDPNRFILLRGNHEISKINQKYGFKAVVKRIFGCSYLETPGVLCDLIYNSLNLAFDNLPLCADIRRDRSEAGIFCCHGGVPNAELRDREGVWLVEDLNQLGAHGLKPHCLIPARNSTKQLLAMNEILWNDPLPDKLHHRKPNKVFLRNKKRGGHCSYFSNKAVDDFLSANNYFAIIRGHQFKQTKNVGFCFQFDQKVITVFSGSNYCGNERNATGYILVEANCDINANTLRTAEQTEQYRNLNRFLLEIDPKTKEPKYCIF